MKVELDGKIALVTGAGQGIGLAIADTLGRNGAQVVYTDIDLQTAQAAADASEGAAGFAIDVASPADVSAGVARVLRDFGRIDILVNNAGIGVQGPERKTIDEFSLEAWDAVLKIDLTGLFLMSREVSRAMKVQKSGRIINIASVLGLVPARLQSSYIAAKAGVVNLTKAMALELAPHGVLVNAVAPGSTQTQSLEKWIRDADSESLDLHARFMSHIPLGRSGTTQEMANAVLFWRLPRVLTSLGMCSRSTAAGPPGFPGISERRGTHKRFNRKQFSQIATRGLSPEELQRLCLQQLRRVGHAAHSKISVSTCID